MAGQCRAIAVDDDAQDFLDNGEMTKAFAMVASKAMRPFDVIGMDACLMIMVETCLQVQGSGTVFALRTRSSPTMAGPTTASSPPLRII